MKYLLTFIIATASVLSAQDADRVTVPLTDPSRPATLQIDVMHGNMVVRAHAAKDIVVEMGASSRRTPRRDNEGLRRLEMLTSGLEIEENANTVRINSGGRSSGNNIVVLVPQNTSVKLRSQNGRIEVEGVRGEVEASSQNSDVRLTNVEGSVVAHSQNGKVLVTLNSVAPNKAMSFSSMNGDVDVTIPADTKARLRLKNENGEVWTDFEMKLESTPKVESGRQEDGRYKVKFDRTVVGTINGGGPDMSFNTMNGQIRIRKQK